MNRRELLTGVQAAQVMHRAITGQDMEAVRHEKIAAKVRTWQGREVRRRARLDAAR